MTDFRRIIKCREKKWMFLLLVQSHILTLLMQPYHLLFMMVLITSAMANNITPSVISNDETISIVSFSVKAIWVQHVIQMNSCCGTVGYFHMHDGLKLDVVIWYSAYCAKNADLVNTCPPESCCFGAENICALMQYQQLQVFKWKIQTYIHSWLKWKRQHAKKTQNPHPLQCLDMTSMSKQYASQTIKW